MKRIWSFLWENRTRTFAFVQGLVATLVTMTDVFTPKWLKVLLVANALLTYALGQFNSWQDRQRPPPNPPSEQP